MEPLGAGRVEHLRLRTAVVAQVVLAILAVGDCLLVDVTSRFGHYLHCCLGENYFKMHVLSEEVRGRIDHLGLSL